MSNNFSSGEKLKLTVSDKSYGNLKSIAGYEAYSELFNYRLKLLTNNKDIAGESLCNKNISFAIEASIDGKDQPKRLFNGLIEKVSFTKRHNPKESPNPEIEYYLEVVPKLAVLAKVKRSKVFYAPEQSLVDVIEKLLKEHKIDYELSIKNPKLFIAETCIQYNESDYDFFYRLMQEAGLGYFFKHEKNKHILVLTNQPSAYFDINDKLLTYVDDKGQTGGLHNIYSQYSAHVADFTVQAFAYSKPKDLASKSYTTPLHKKQDNQTLKTEKSVYTNEIKDLGQVTELAQNFGLAEQFLSEQIKGQSNYTSFAVGAKFQLSGKFFDSLKLDKEYVIIGLTFEANDQVTEQYVNEFAAVPSSRCFISTKTVIKPVIAGLHFATIVNKEGQKESQEPYCDESGRVYIKLLWGDKDNLCPANVLSSATGFTLPRIGSLAYVSFPHNNLYNDIPVIVGISNEGLINFKDKEEWYNNIYKTYPATSDKELYNFIAFKDKKENQEIKVCAKKDMIVEVLNDQTTSIKKIRKVTVEEGNDLLDINKGDIIIKIAEGKYNFYCKGQMVIKSDDSIQIESKTDFTMKSGGKFTIESKDGFYVDTKGECSVKSAKDATLSASGDVTIKSSKNLTGKAGMEATYQSGTATNIKANTQISIDGAMTEVKGKANLKVSSPMTKIGM